MSSDTIRDVLADRALRYGAFEAHAGISQSLKTAMAGTTNWQQLASDQVESLEMIAHKIARILNGDPDYADSWVDIAGYATLVANRLNQAAEARD